MTHAEVTFSRKLDDGSASMMMTSSNGNIFRVTGHLSGEFTGPGEFPTQRPVTRSFDVFFDLRLNKRLSKQLWGWWFETPSWSWWRQCNDDTETSSNFGHILNCISVTMNTPSTQLLTHEIYLNISGNNLHPTVWWPCVFVVYLKLLCKEMLRR